MHERGDPDDEIAPAIDDNVDCRKIDVTSPVLPSDLDSVVLHGIDVVSIDRIASLLVEFGESFRRRVFTASERTYCESQGTPSQHYAARWAAKEAFYKTLDDGSPAIPLNSIEIVREEAGPRLTLEPPASRAFDRTLERENIHPDATDIALSLSHDRNAGYAVGSVTVFGIETRYD